MYRICICHFRYLASNATRYGNARTSGQKGGSYQIKDRKNWLGTVELWYKDAASLELLGWDKKSDSFRFILPWEKAKQEVTTNPIDCCDAYHVFVAIMNVIMLFDRPLKQAKTVPNAESDL